MNRQELKDQSYIRSIRNIAELSKDENTKVGAKIIAYDGSPVSEGYNGGSRHIDDEFIPYTREERQLTDDLSSNKYPFMLHAELNAILHARDRNDLIGATIYVTHLPCPTCANVISQMGIKRVVIPENSIARLTGEHEQKLTNYIFAKSQILLHIVKEKDNGSN